MITTISVIVAFLIVGSIFLLAWFILPYIDPVAEVTIFNPNFQQETAKRGRIGFAKGVLKYHQKRMRCAGCDVCLAAKDLLIHEGVPA